MSADKNTQCPNCRVLNQQKIQTLEQHVVNAYGTVSRSEFEKLNQELEALKNTVLDESLAEYYEISGAATGTVEVDYSAHCTVCKYAVSFSHNHELMSGSRLELKDQKPALREAFDGLPEMTGVVALKRIPGKGVNIALREVMTELTGATPVVLDINQASDVSVFGALTITTVRALSEARVIIIDSPARAMHGAYQAILTTMIGERTVTGFPTFSKPAVFTLRDNVLIVISDVERDARFSYLDHLYETPNIVRLPGVFG